MPRGSAKFGGKSGVLPEVRQIFKQPIKPVVRPANPNVGYADGVEHPEGISREQPLPTVRTVSGLIKDTVKDPKIIPDLNALNDFQKEKVTKAALRRQYYVDSLKKEERRLSYTEQKMAQREAEEKRIKEESKYEMSESTKLTLPTISRLLEGPLMRERTEEEKQILHAKREANRLDQELRGKENRADDLLDVYYAAENFIVTEEDLEAAIEDAFTTSSLSTVFTGTHVNRSHNPALLDALFGTIKSKPGLVEVEEEITGERADFQQKVADAWAQEIKREEAESLDALNKN